jgi:GT2 family glycosyltransferase
MVSEKFPAVHLIANTENIGYSKANNQAIRQSHSRYVLLLNPDVEVQPDTLQKIVDYADAHPSVGVCGCCVRKPDGSVDKACRRRFPDTVSSLLHFSGLARFTAGNRRYNMDFPDDCTVEVDSVMGAFFLIRRSVVDAIGLLDEDFFLYGEDLDWCYRAKQAGYKVMYAPVSTVIHHKGSSSRRSPARSLYEFHRSMKVFYDKHYRRDRNAIVNILVDCSIWTRYSVKVLQNAFRKEKYVSK